MTPTNVRFSFTVTESQDKKLRELSSRGWRGAHGSIGAFVRWMVDKYDSPEPPLPQPREINDFGRPAPACVQLGVAFAAPQKRRVEALALAATAREKAQVSPAEIIRRLLDMTPADAVLPVFELRG